MRVVASAQHKQGSTASGCPDTNCISGLAILEHGSPHARSLSGSPESLRSGVEVTRKQLAPCKSLMVLEWIVGFDPGLRIFLES